MMKTLKARSNFTLLQPIFGGYGKFILLLLASIVLTSCSSDDDVNCTQLEVELEGVTTVNAPETAQVNETIDIEVLFEVKNSCGEFSRFIETGTPMDREIEVEARYEGCNCSQVIETITANYEFTPEEAGEYTLNFRSGADEFITVDISVTEEP